MNLRIEGSRSDQEREILTGVEKMKNLLALMLCCGLGLLVLGCSGEGGAGGGDGGTETEMPSTTGMADQGATDGEGGDATEGEGGDAAEGEGGDAAEGGDATEAEGGDAKEGE